MHVMFVKMCLFSCTSSWLSRCNTRVQDSNKVSSYTWLECWTLYVADGVSLDIFERTIWRGIFGPVGEGSHWRTRYSKKLHDLFHETKLSVYGTLGRNECGRPSTSNEWTNCKFHGGCLEPRQMAEENLVDQKQKGLEEVNKDARSMGIRQSRSAALDIVEQIKLIIMARTVQELQPKR